MNPVLKSDRVLRQPLLVALLAALPDPRDPLRERGHLRAEQLLDAERDAGADQQLPRADALRDLPAAVPAERAAAARAALQAAGIAELLAGLLESAAGQPVPDDAGYLAVDG